MRASRFLGSESGAITVDWTVLAAAVVGLGVASVGAVRSGVGALGSDVETSLSSASVSSLGTLGQPGSSPTLSYTPRVLTQASMDYWIDYIQNVQLPAQGVDATLFHYKSLTLDPLATTDPANPYFDDRMDWAYAYYTALTRAGVTIPADYAHFPDILAANPT